MTGNCFFLFFSSFFWPVDWKKNLMPKSLVEKNVVSANIEKAWVLYMSFDNFVLAVESRDLSQADKSII